MKSIYRAIAIMAAASVSLLAFGDTMSPLVGTWVLNVKKSDFGGAPALKSYTNVVTDAGNGQFHYSVTMVDADGKNVHFEITGATDGKDYPISGFSDYADTAATTSCKPGTLHIVLKKAGKTVEWDTFTASKDGKTLDGHLAGDDGGTRWKNHWVLKRQ